MERANQIIGQSFPHAFLKFPRVVSWIYFFSSQTFIFSFYQMDMVGDGYMEGWSHKDLILGDCRFGNI